MKVRRVFVAEALYGTYTPSIDAKGRMSFPNKLRDILGPEFYLCAGHDNHYIAVYSPEKFDEYQGKLNTIPGKQGSIIRRKLLSCTDKQIPDKQGRIFITQALRDHAQIGDDVVVVGAIGRAEIWNAKLWRDFNEEVSFDDINSALEDFVI